MTGERALCAELARFFAPPRGRAVIGIGDDAAVVAHRGARLVAACDPVVEGVHFTAAAPLRRVGHKVVHRNLADLAAMGAEFDYALLSIVWPRRRRQRQLWALLAGVRSAVETAGGVVIGGDLAASAGPLTVTLTALGHLAGRPLRRAGARPGDAIHVTGPLGGAGLGRHLRFRAPLAEGRWLARQAAVGAAMDVSDGFALDLSTLLAASRGRLGAEIDERALPIAAAARRAARGSGRTPLDHALHDGEDHHLLFTVRANRRLAAGGPLTARARRPVGVVDRSGRLTLRRRDGVVLPLAAIGFEHDV